MNSSYIFILSIFVLTCSKSNENTLIGTWESQPNGYMDDATFTFFPNGDFEVTYGTYGSDMGTWMLTSDILNMTVDNDPINVRMKLTNQGMEWDMIDEPVPTIYLIRVK